MLIMFALFSLYFWNTNQLITVISKHHEVNFITTLHSLNGEVLEIQTHELQSFLHNTKIHSPQRHAF